MSVGFYTYDLKERTDIECSLCLDFFIPKKSENDKTYEIIVAHHDFGEAIGSLHPIHRKCILPWLVDHSSCPTCHTQVDKNTLFTRMDRVYNNLNFIKKGVVTGTITGLMASIVNITISKLFEAMISNKMDVFSAPTLMLGTILGMCVLGARYCRRIVNQGEATQIAAAMIAGTSLISGFATGVFRGTSSLPLSNEQMISDGIIQVISSIAITLFATRN